MIRAVLWVPTTWCHRVDWDYIDGDWSWWSQGWGEERPTCYLSPGWWWTIP